MSFLRALLLKDELKIPINISSISIHEISFKIDDLTLNLAKHDNLEILLAFSNEKLEINITIFNIKEHDSYFLINAFIKHVPKNEEILKKYISKREQELIEEFKNMFLYE